MGAQTFDFALEFPQNGEFLDPKFVFLDIFPTRKFSEG